MGATTRVDAPRLVKLYGIVLGGGLLLEGGGLLLLDVLRTPTSDTRHNVLHVVWGIAILILTGGKSNLVPAALVMLVFGIFYIALGIAGLLFDRPFGLLLGPGENAFHFTVGPVALVLGAMALAQLWSSSASRAATVASASTTDASGTPAPR